MFYTSLSDIKLSVFIDIMTGNQRAVIVSGEHTDDECSVASADLVLKYIELCGGKRYTAQLESRKKMVNIHIRRNCIETAYMLAKSGMYDDSCRILKKLGWSISPDDPEKLMNRLNAIRAKAELDMNTLPKEDDNERKSISRTDFSKERVMLMCHYKMYIDENVWTAEEYAILISQYNAEVARMKAMMAKKK